MVEWLNIFLFRRTREGYAKVFKEKPKVHEVTSHYINVGIYIFEPDLLKTIPSGRAVSVERETFPRPCGWVVDKASSKLLMYYGAADTCIALATAGLSDLMDYIRSCPKA